MKSILCLSIYVNSLCQFSSVYLSIMDSADEKYFHQLYYNPKHIQPLVVLVNFGKMLGYMVEA